MDRWTFDSEPSARFPVYTRANIDEVWREPATPLSATLSFERISEQAWRDAWVRLGAFRRDEFDPDRPENLAIFGGYGYLNVSVIRVFAVRTGSTAEAIDQAYFGSRPGVPPYVEHEDDVDPERTAAAAATVEWVLAARSLPDVDEDRELVERMRRERPDMTGLADHELLTLFVDPIEVHLRRLHAQHLFHTFAASIPTGILQGLCATAGRPEVALRLVGGLGDVASAHAAVALWDLSRVPPESEGFAAAWDAFMAAHGSGGPNDWDTGSSTWETDPETLEQALAQLRSVGDERSPRRRQEALVAERSELVSSLRDALADDAEASAQLDATLRSVALFVTARERAKANIVGLIHETRVPFRELGRRMVARGLLDDERDMLFLTVDELKPWLADPAAFRDSIAERKAVHTDLAQVEPPYVVAGSPPPRSTWPRRSPAGAPARVGDVIVGQPGSPGQADGRVCVVRDVADGARFRPGDVLVTPVADISSTPLLLAASAVVVDLGATMSHFAILSRELGVPCVVSTTDASRRLRAGATVLVDGDAGVVTVLDA